MGILDLTDDLDWKGRVNMIRADFSGVDYTDPETQVYDIAYIAAFRTIEDAEKYAKDYLIKLLGQMPETEEATSDDDASGVDAEYWENVRKIQMYIRGRHAGRLERRGGQPPVRRHRQPRVHLHDGKARPAHHPGALFLVPVHL